VKFVEEAAEWVVYLVAVALIAAWLPRNFVELVHLTEVQPAAAAASVYEFSPADALASQIMSVSLVGRIPVAASSEESERRHLERYRNHRHQLSAEELIDLLEETGFSGPGLRQAWAVVMKESTGYPLAHNTNASTSDNSYGLFQINMYGNLEEYRREKFDLPSNEVLFDPVLNAEIAFVLSKGGTDFGHWNVGPNAYNGDGSPPGYLRWLAEYPEE
jgi:hypothetical protein